MKNLSWIFLLPVIVGLTACTSSLTSSRPPTDLSQQIDVTLSPDMPRETVLLVALDDGSVIMQTIHSSADLCFKTSSDSATTCLTQGDPVYDPTTNAVIGFEMIEDHIELVAKSD
jgi:hypothetical protein